MNLQARAQGYVLPRVRQTFLCRFRFLERSLKIEVLTRSIEFRLFSAFPFSTCDFLQAIRSLHKPMNEHIF